MSPLPLSARKESEAVKDLTGKDQSPVKDITRSVTPIPPASSSQSPVLAKTATTQAIDQPAPSQTQGAAPTPPPPLSQTAPNSSPLQGVLVRPLQVTANRVLPEGRVCVLACPIDDGRGANIAVLQALRVSDMSQGLVATPFTGEFERNGSPLVCARMAVEAESENVCVSMSACVCMGGCLSVCLCVCASE